MFWGERPESIVKLGKADWSGGATQFNHLNDLSLIARAHQLVQEGYKHMFDGALVTVWSAPKSIPFFPFSLPLSCSVQLISPFYAYSYCYRCGNLASIMEVGDGGKTEFKTFEAAPENETDERNPASRRGGQGAGAYFV